MTTKNIKNTKKITATILKKLDKKIEKVCKTYHMTKQDFFVQALTNEIDEIESY